MEKGLATKDRSYPTRCLSAYCGKTSCPSTCRNLPALTEFKTWQKEHAAIREDWIWCPTIWTATR